MSNYIRPVLSPEEYISRSSRFLRSKCCLDLMTTYNNLKTIEVLSENEIVFCCHNTLSDGDALGTWFYTMDELYEYLIHHNFEDTVWDIDRIFNVFAMDARDYNKLKRLFKDSFNPMMERDYMEHYKIKSKYAYFHENREQNKKEKDNGKKKSVLSIGDDDIQKPYVQKNTLYNYFKK